MDEGKRRIAWLVGGAAAYQVTVFVFVAGGGFGDIYYVLGFPWNDSGTANVVHTSICWAVVELPLLVAAVVAIAVRSRHRRQ